MYKYISSYKKKHLLLLPAQFSPALAPVTYPVTILVSVSIVSRHEPYFANKRGFRDLFPLSTCDCKNLMTWALFLGAVNREGLTPGCVFFLLSRRPSLLVCYLTQQVPVTLRYCTTSSFMYVCVISR